MRVFKKVTGGILWFLFPLLGLNLLLIPFCKYGMTTFEMMWMMGIVMAAMTLLTVFENYAKRGMPPRESNTVGGCSVELHTNSTEKANINFEFIFWTSIFVILTLLGAHIVYSKITAIMSGFRVPNAESVLVLDALALFILTRSLISFVKKKITV